MYFTRNRRSWPMLLPHRGDSPADRYCFRNASVSCSASASLVLLSFTRWVRPLAPWVLVHHSSMASSRLSGWCMAITGPSATRVSSESVIIEAISMIRSFSGSRPVISRSIHTKRLWSGILFFLCGLVWELVQVWLCFPETAPCGTSMWRFCSAIHGSAHFRKAQPHLHFGLHCWPRVELKPTPWLVVLAGDTFPGVSEAKDGFRQAHKIGRAHV